VRAPNVGVSNPLRKRSAVAKAELCLFLYKYNGSYPTVRPGLARVFTTELAVFRLKFLVWWHTCLYFLLRCKAAIG
jgi:hypothetical protein